MQDIFRRGAKQLSILLGSPWAFFLSVFLVLLWGVSGPIFGYSDTWQLVINTATTVITFLMVFIIQNTQNRDSHALQLKLDELIRAQRGARTGLVNLEELSDEELERLQEEFKRLQQEDASGIGQDGETSGAEDDQDRTGQAGTGPTDEGSRPAADEEGEEGSRPTRMAA